MKCGKEASRIPSIGIEAYVDENKEVSEKAKRRLPNDGT